MESKAQTLEVVPTLKVSERIKQRWEEYQKNPDAIIISELKPHLKYLESLKNRFGFSTYSIGQSRVTCIGVGYEDEPFYKYLLHYKGLFEKDSNLESFYEHVHGFAGDIENFLASRKEQSPSKYSRCHSNLHNLLLACEALLTEQIIARQQPSITKEPEKEEPPSPPSILRSGQSIFLKEEVSSKADISDVITPVEATIPASNSFFAQYKKHLLAASVGTAGVAVGIWQMVDYLSKNPDRAGEIQTNFINTITDPKYGALLGVAFVALLVTGCYLLCRRSKQSQELEGMDQTAAAALKPT